jgi:hypothetical protein
MSERRSDDPRYEWISLKAYALDRGYNPRTVRSWIKAGYLVARREGPMPRGRWFVQVVRVESHAS